MDKQSKVAVLSINIGDYDVFWEEFYQSSELNFLPEYEKDYYVFSNKKELYGLEHDNVFLIFQKDMGWPYNSMKRFEMFYRIRKKLNAYKYIFFANANTKFVFPLRKGFIDLNKNLITAEHPGYHLAKCKDKPFEMREESRAYVKKKNRKIYVQGAFYGGTAECFLQMACELYLRTKEDLEKGIVAVWHDESFLNAYISERNDVQILGWQYLYYEEYVLPYRPVILLRNKRKYITNKNGRFSGKNYAIEDLKLIIRNIKWRLFIMLGVYKKCGVCDESGQMYIDRNIKEL